MKLISLFLCATIIFIPAYSLAQEPDYRITSVEESQPAPFKGILLTQDSLAKIESDLRTKVKVCKNDCKLRLDELKLLHNRDILLIESEANGLSQIIKTKDSRIAELEKIVEDGNNSWTVPLVAVASFVLGVTVTVGITYAVNR